MILIANSGSTRCDWRILNGDQVAESFITVGFNPYFHHEGVISNTLQQHYQIIDHADSIEYLFFYGAGCSDKKYRILIERALQAVFKKAKIYVDHDLTAAAFSTYENRLSITCILGTGSNSCSFDGDIVREQVPALDFILGDEGSASHFGKRLLRDYLYDLLPEELSLELFEKYRLSKDEIIENVYRKPYPNVYLASFMPFIIEKSKDEYLSPIIREGLKEFLEIHVCSFPDYSDVKTHFIGSVSHAFQDELKSLSSELNIDMGKVIQYPIDNLVDYHIKYHYPKLAKLNNK
ncbi:MAG: ATPase [Bacteroidota bacterium]